jgi:quinolinate synthase
VVRSVDPKRAVIFVPDRHLGHYAARMTGRKVILWGGSCPTHAAISVADIREARLRQPRARLMAHPECRPDVLKMADHVASTAGMLTYAKEQEPGVEFIVATEAGLIHRLRKENPGKKFHPATNYLVYPTMKLTTLEDVIKSLETLQPEVKVNQRIRVKARAALDAMLVVS